MVGTPAIRNLIREEKIHQIYSIMQASHAHGMQTMNQSLAGLVRERRIGRDEAISRSPMPDELHQLLTSSSPGSIPRTHRGRRSPLGRP